MTQFITTPAVATPLGKRMPPLDPNRAAFKVQYPDLDPGILQAVQVTLTAAQIKALFTTPVALVPAQGAGTIVDIVGIWAKNVFGTVAYTGANALEFRYTDGAGAKVTADIAAAFINTASGTAYNGVKGVNTALTPVANAAVVVAVPTANPAAGDSLITFTVLYRVLTL